MPEERKIPRLGKAASEFNVKTSTIVELLIKKGFEIEDNRNAKLTPEMYDILLKEYQQDKESKENSAKLDMDYSYKKEEEAQKQVVQPKTAPKVEKPVVKEPVKKAVEVKPQPAEPEVTKTAPAAQPEQKPEAEPIKEPAAAEPAAKAEEPAPIGLKVLGHIDLEPKPKKKSKQSAKEQPEAEKTETEKPAEPEEAKPEPKQKQKKTPEHIETTVEHLPGLTVRGKIDLNAPKKSVKEEPATIAEPEPEAEPQAEVQPEPAQPQPEEKKVEHIETVVEHLEGPKILGKIELPVEKKESKKEVKPDDKKKANKKRKRILKPVANSSQDNTLHQHKKQEQPKKEISSEEVARQMKETMMRMNPIGKTKTSKYKKEKRKAMQEEMLENELREEAEKKILKVTEFITANELSTLMNISVNQIISTCMSIGLFVSINQRLDAETISLLAEEFGFQVEFAGVDTDEANAFGEDAPEDLKPRHPIITVMGHVDHGKTSLLDYIRKTNVIAGEAGGITQHIGAYEVQLADGRKITFLDTPGHEAFTAMRARGAKVTDLCIIVIAADDAIMPQTVEAINHAQAAGVPMVFAITKIDKPQANPDKIREGLANMNILVEEWGGKYQCQEIDAKHGTNVNELLDKVLLEAELLDLKANPDRPGVGTVIESSLDKGKGYVAKVLVQNGTMRVGDPILAGTCFGKIRAMYNERNQLVKEAGPATPVLLLGLNGAPQAGDICKVCESDHEARIAANKRTQLVREMGLRTQKHITLDEIGRRLAIGDFKELNIIVKADVDGSAEALTDELLKLSTEQVQVNVIHKSVGQVTDSDVLLASASNAIIVAFQVRPSASSRKLAEQEQIDIRTYSIIYNAISEIKDAIAGMHSPEIQEKIVCNLEIKEVYHISKVGNIAGCIVLDGKLQKSTRVHVIRDGIVIHTGKLGSLRRFKDDVKEVVAGQDCGLNIESYNDIQVGDIVEGYEEVEVRPTL
ncbi:MAG: translation initiation factor IF-2 [Bacteroidales bacterium]|nr:translation initiation factor IF-2 [Bacteroidales bacterium]